jgi:hypothetical protein
VGMQVLVNDGHDWTRNCWFVRGMSGHESYGLLKGMFDPSSVGTLTYIKTIKTIIENGWPPCSNNSQ